MLWIEAEGFSTICRVACRVENEEFKFFDVGNSLATEKLEVFAFRGQEVREKEREKYI